MDIKYNDLLYIKYKLQLQMVWYQLAGFLIFTVQLIFEFNGSVNSKL